MINSSDDLSSATAAYLKGVQCAPNGQFWLKRALRLAPADPRIELEIARQKLSAGSQESESAYIDFLRLAKQYDIAPAWIGAAVSAQILGDARASAEALEALLKNHCIPDDKAFSNFAQHIATISGYDGYQGYNTAGVLVRVGTGHLLGSKPNLEAIQRVEGLVEWKAGGLSGWAARRACPDQPPVLTLKDALGRALVVKCGPPLPLDEVAPFLSRYRFRVSSARLKGFLPPFVLSGSINSQLMGSPIDPLQIECLPIAASYRGELQNNIPKTAPLVLIMPVYGGLDETQAAVYSVLEAAPPNVRFIIVNDASPEPILNEWLEKLEHENKIELIRHEQNLGFCAAVNSGLANALGCDVLLLNSDILLPNGVIETLKAAAYSNATVGTVTPLSNEATICSYPNANAENTMPDLATANLYNRLAITVNGVSTVEIPTGIGFCMYIRHDCLSATGPFRFKIFAQGYGEENDFCIRARHLGYKHVAAVGAYVAHQGGVSFRSAARYLVKRNTKIINQLYPGYQDLINEHIAEDPISPFRIALDQARLIQEQATKESILFISHAHGGGVAKYVEMAMSRAREMGLNPLLLTAKFPRKTGKSSYPWPSLLCAGNPKEYPNLAFTMPENFVALLSLLRHLNIKCVEMHHMLGQHNIVRDIAKALGVPRHITIHDYASFCPRVNLLSKSNTTSKLRYCGEPDVSGCIKCCSYDKKGIFESRPIRQHLSRSYKELMSADRVTVPTLDVARRISRHFPGISPEVTPWEDDSTYPTLFKPRLGKRRIALIGGIGPSKGFDILLDCARDIHRRLLPLEFIVIGNSADDNLLLEAGVLLTGRYNSTEVQDLVLESKSDLAFLPSICPETWCFALSEAWRAGLYTIVFDLGSQAERVRATGRGATLPLGLSPERINNALMNTMF